MGEQHVEVRGRVTNYLNKKAARDSAKRVGAPYGNVFTTTPGYLSSESGRFAHNLYNECFQWTEKLFDTKDEDDLRDHIKKNTPSGKIQVVLDYNHRQLGYTDEWLREKIADAMSDGEDAGADYLNLWAMGNITSPISKELLALMKDSVKGDPYIDISKYGYITRWYIPESEVLGKCPKRKLVLGLDTSDATGRDDIGMVIRDAYTGEVVASGAYNETNLITFAEWLVDIIVTYPNLTMIIERKSSGVTIIDYLIKLLVVKDIDPFKRLFNWVVNDNKLVSKYKKEVLGVPMRLRNPIVYETYRNKFGYGTTGGTGNNSRHMLYGEVFKTSIKYTADTVHDKKLYEQLAGLTTKNDRIDHGNGGHDDIVVAWLLVYYFLSKAEGKEFYGLDGSRVLGTVTNAIIDEQGGQEAIVHRAKQKLLKRNIDILIEGIKKERNTILVKRMSAQIRKLYSKIDTKVIPALNLDAVLEAIENEKKENRYKIA